MAQINKEDVKKIAHLARLALTDSEVELFCKEFQDVISHFEEISKITTAGVEPLSNPPEISSHEREDVAQQGFSSVDDLMKNAPERVADLFRVPPVV